MFVVHLGWKKTPGHIYIEHYSEELLMFIVGKRGREGGVALVF